MVGSQRCSPTAAPYGVVYNHHDQESTTYVPEEIQACANRLKSRVPEDCSIEQWTEALHQEVPAVPRPVDMTDTPPLFPCHRLLLMHWLHQRIRHACDGDVGILHCLLMKDAVSAFVVRGSKT